MVVDFALLTLFFPHIHSPPKLCLLLFVVGLGYVVGWVALLRSFSPALNVVGALLVPSSIVVWWTLLLIPRCCYCCWLVLLCLDCWFVVCLPFPYYGCCRLLDIAFPHLPPPTHGEQLRFVVGAPLCRYALLRTDVGSPRFDSRFPVVCIG